MEIFAIDPGPTESAYVILDENTLKPLAFNKLPNNEIIAELLSAEHQICNHGAKFDLAIEMVASYGMAVGKEVFETVFWIGRFWEVATSFERRQFIYRKDEKMNLCHSMKANDSNIRQALIDRFAYGVPNKGKGKKDSPGWFYGFSDDIWQAYAVGVTYHDLYLKGA